MLCADLCQSLDSEMRGEVGRDHMATPTPIYSFFKPAVGGGHPSIKALGATDGLSLAKRFLPLAPLYLPEFSGPCSGQALTLVWVDPLLPTPQPAPAHHEGLSCWAAQQTL